MLDFACYNFYSIKYKKGIVEESQDKNLISLCKKEFGSLDGTKMAIRLQ